MIPIQCASCKNYLKDGKCKAFPKIIPKLILTSKFNHEKPYPGDNDHTKPLPKQDNDIVFEEKKRD